MSLPRKDVRFHVDAHVHIALKAVASADRKDIDDLVEEIVVREVARRIHQASVLLGGLDQTVIARIRDQAVGSGAE